MYTIKQAAARTGTSVPVLRAWERRYRIVTPARTAAGYRLYDDGAIERLGTMRRLVDAGWTPSAAAEAILSGTAPAAIAVPGPERTEASPSGPLSNDSLDLREAFVAAAADLDSDAIEVLLDEMFARGTFERMADDHLLPAVVALGDAWASGRIDVAAEHFASHAVLRRLAAAFQAAGRAGPETGSILVGLPPGSRHELGGLAFAVAGRRAGLPILYLGPDLPAADWVATANRVAARATVIGSVTPADRAAARDVAAAIRSAKPGVVIAYGGRYPPDEDPAGVSTAAIHLPPDLPDAIAALENALAAAAGRD